jgi:hypothetical protein
MSTGVARGGRFAWVLAAAGATGVGCEQDYAVKSSAPEVDPGEVTDCGFTQVEDTEFWRYDCNPVFTGTDEDWVERITGTAFHVTNVLGHPYYQLWYTAASGSTDGRPFGMGYAVSTDGTDWTAYEGNPVLSEPGDERAWNADLMDRLQIIYDPAEDLYVGLYLGVNKADQVGGFGVIASHDGWTWYRRNDMVYSLDTQVEDVQGWCWPLGISLGEVSGYTGYVAGRTEPQGGGEDPPVCRAYRLNGTDFENWTPIADEPILDAGAEGEWDDEGIVSLATATLGDDKLMFYVGFGTWTDDPANSRNKIASESFVGMAKMDGEGNWEKSGDLLPLHNLDDGDGGFVAKIAAYTVGPRVHAWITDAYCEVEAGAWSADLTECAANEKQQAVGYFLYEPGRAERLAAEDA